MTANSRKRVLQIQLRYNVNASDLAEQIIAGLPSDQYEVTTLFLRGRPDPSEPISAAAHSVYFDCSPSDLKGFKRWAVVRRLFLFCQQQGFDAVIAHRFKPISMMMWISRFLHGTVFIGVEHGIGDYDRLMRRVEARALISNRWRMVGVSRAVKTYLIDRVAAFTSNNTLAINNAIDIQRARCLMLAADAARETLGLPKSGKIIGCIGRLVPVKGHALLIEAFSRISGRYPDALIAVIGEGRSREDLETLIARYGLQQQVILLGARNDALQYVRAFDIFAMPSYSEGLPLALLEGLAGERPVVGSDIPSMLPILQDCGGSVFRSADAEDLARQLDALLALDPASLANKGALGFEYLCKNHSIDEFRNSYRDLLDDLLGNLSGC
ncbi:glycosyltransferase [Halopseudomonas yangmingensis]|uniref:Glycosyltransferase involved in cell wall bisynthesis n=1 Tax=Halopseudomonas yangmingensis TaxID=1720063 RepID=A0A1I4T182_9GAMM|nr:glycosyltransferase [Halopseudomonas yangmingensis]SFM70340.1 Glycosyltransferase involved in cell wall bisynthesis [Halopseudomonas yangmingensis]